jgi:hypothetical protein
MPFNFFSGRSRVAPQLENLRPTVTSISLQHHSVDNTPTDLFQRMRAQSTIVPKDLYYSNPNKFTTDLLVSHNLINARARHNNRTPHPNRKQLADAYHLYANALAKPEQIIGNNDIIWASPDLISNFGATSGYSNNAYQTRTQEILNSSDTTDHVRNNISQVSASNGLILFGDHWTILANDGLIIAKCHAISKYIADHAEENHGMVYFAAHDSFLDNPMLDVWCKHNNRLRVTGREIIGLYHFGFRPYIRRNAQGTLFAQFVLKGEENIAKARSANLISYTKLMLDPKWNDVAYVEHFFRTDIAQYKTCW